MKRYVGIHLNTTAVRMALLAGDKPVLIPTADGGSSYSTVGLFALVDHIWTCDGERLERLLRQLRADVECFAGAAEWEMVLTLPVAFGLNLERDILRPAAQRAGLPVAYVLRESTAVALNYVWNGMGRGEDVFRIMVGMVSRDTIGISVLEASEDVLEDLTVTSKRGNVSPEMVRRRMELALQEAEAGRPVDGLPVAGAGVRALMLNNESVRKPEYREVLTGLKRSGQKVYGYPDETAAFGAAIQAAKLSGDRRCQEPLMLRTLSHDYYIMLAERHRIKLLSHDTTIPVKKSMVFTTVKDRQTDALIRVTEAEGEMSPLETVMQIEQKELTPRPARSTRILVTMDVDANGDIRCTSRECGPEEYADLPSAGALPPLRFVNREKESAVETASGQNPAGADPERQTPESDGKKEMPGKGAETKMPTVPLAEFENFRRRMTQEKDAMFDQGIRKALEKFLPVMDSFERGLAMLPPEQRGTDAAIGMERIYRQMQKAMEELGVRPIEAVGKTFDLNLHNAVMQAEIPGVDENIIVEEFEKGYLYRDTVLRYSTVKVNK